MEVMNSLSDLSLFGFIFFSVAVGWFIGYTRGVINGYNHAHAEGLEEYPISNVYFFETDTEDKYSFIDMVTGRMITVGTFDECLELVRSNNAEKKVVFSKGDKDEQ